MTAPADPAPLPLAEARETFPPCWVIYERPADYPHGYVVRVWWGVTPEPGAHRCATVVEAREHVVACGGSVRFAHAPGRESAAILESWL